MTETWRLLTNLPIPTDLPNCIPSTSATSSALGGFGEGPSLQPPEVVPDPKHRLEAAFNMAVDEAIVTAYDKVKTPPTLRLYTWQKPSLTMGYFQSVQEQLDWPVCKNHQIPVIRRITGGRAVLHGQDLTYSVIAGLSSPTFPTQNIKETFFTIGQALLWSLKCLGISAEAAASSPRNDKSPLCFASPSWYEITCKGRKVIGSAQRRWKDVFLQQGSALIEFNPSDFYRFFRFPTTGQRTRLIRLAETQAAGLSECAKRSLSSDEVKAAVVAGFEKTLKIVLKPGGLTAQEMELAHHLTLKKYLRNDWNLRRLH